MKASDITPFELHTLGNKARLDEGRHGIPVVALMIDKFTELTAPCGKVYQLYGGKKSKEVLVAIRPEDAKNLWSYTSTNGWYGDTKIEPLGPDDEWIPLVVSTSQIRMTWDEYRLKADSRQELIDVLKIEMDRSNAAKRAYSESVGKLVKKVSKDTSWTVDHPFREPTVQPTVTVTLTLGEFVRIATRPSPAVKGVKTLLTQIDADRKAYVSAHEGYQRASTCVERAGIRNY